MKTSLRSFTRGDVALGDSLRALAGWNQTTADWERFIAHDPDGGFVAEWDGTPVGTATTTVYGPALAWIGMVLVHPEYRRRGIGRALLERCVTHLQERRIRCIKLDATPAGRPVYQALGFRDEWTLTRWARPGGPGEKQFGVPEPSAPGIRAVQATDRPELERFDEKIFGVARGWLWRLLVADSRAAMLAEDSLGRFVGAGLLRPGARAFYLGPVVADSLPAALGLVEELIRRAGDAPIFWDIPDAIAAVGGWANRHGFVRQRGLTRMFLGSNETPGDSQRQFAIAGPEVG